jgi:hypothetical protein
VLGSLVTLTAISRCEQKVSPALHGNPTLNGTVTERANAALNGTIGMRSDQDQRMVRLTGDLLMVGPALEREILKLVRDRSRSWTR